MNNILKGRNNGFQPVVVFSVVITLIGVIMDFSARFFNEQTYNQNRTVNYSLTGSVLNNVTDKQVEKIIALYQQYRVEDKSVSDNEKIKKDTLATKVNQSGALAVFITDNNKLVLKGVVDDKTNKVKVALIQVTNIKNSEHKLVRFTNKSKIFDYTLNIKSNTQIELIRPNAEQQQKIILSIFKVNKAN